MLAPVFPMQDDSVAQSVKLCMSSVSLLAKHVALKRVGLMLMMETELEYDDRLPRRKGFGGVLGCIRHVYSSSGLLGFVRGIIPHVCIEAMRLVRDTVVLHFVQKYPTLDIPPTAAPWSALRIISTPAILSAICWPMKSIYNTLQANYMTDVMSVVAVEVGVNASDPQERLSYRYHDLLHCWKIVYKRIGGMKAILHNGWEAYVFNRYISHVLLAVMNWYLQTAARRHGTSIQREAIVHFIEVIVRNCVTFPCKNLMLRMSLLNMEENHARVYGCRRYASTVEAIKKIYAQEGVQGFFTGFYYHIIVTVLLALMDVSFGYCTRAKVKN